MKMISVQLFTQSVPKLSIQVSVWGTMSVDLGQGHKPWSLLAATLIKRCRWLREGNQGLQSSQVLMNTRHTSNRTIHVWTFGDAWFM